MKIRGGKSIFTFFLLIFFIFSVSIGVSYAKKNNETLYYNGKIFSGDKNNILSWFVVRDGIIIDKGSNKLETQEVKKYKNSINFNNWTVIPGIIDSHLHFIDGALGLISLSLKNNRSISDTKKTLSKIKSPNFGDIIFATQLKADLIKKIKNPRIWLDNINNNVPVFLFSDGHRVITNSKGLSYIKISKKTKIKDGGIGKDNSGELNGLLTEGGAFEANKRISERLNFKILSHAIIRGQKLALSYGITTIGDNMFTPFYYKAYRRLQNLNILKMRIYARSFGPSRYSYEVVPSLDTKKVWFIGEDSDRDFLNLHSAKFFMTDSLTPHKNGQNAKFSATIEPGGDVHYSENRIKRAFLEYDIPLAFHIQGKEGLKRVLNAVLKTKSRNKRRHILDHIGYATQEQLKKIRELSLAVTILPYAIFEYKDLENYYSKNNKKTFNIDHLLDFKSKVSITNAALTSDWPYSLEKDFIDFSEVDGLNPFPAIAAITSGLTPDKTTLGISKNKLLSVEEAINSYTKNGAFVLGKENVLGKIAKGYKADFVVLNSEIFSLKPADIYKTKVLQTFINGEKVFDRDKEFEDISYSTKLSKSDYAVSPIFGYDPSLGFLMGGAYFHWPLKEDGISGNALLIFTTKGQYKINFELDANKIFKGLNIGIKGFYKTFFDNYYGEGSNSTEENKLELYHNIFSSKVFILSSLTNNIDLSLSTEFQKREVKKVENPDGGIIILGGPFLNDEKSVSFDLSAQFDNRDFRPSPGSGTNIGLSLRYSPKGLSDISSNDNLLQFNLKSSFLKRLYFPKLILGLRFNIGTTISGEPSYLQKYTLGGEYLLRGYYSNRFRGKHFYIGTVELRYPIYRFISGVVFSDFGDVSDIEISDFGKIKFSYGAGLRVKISRMTKLRFDIGFSKENWGIFFTFNEAF